MLRKLFSCSVPNRNSKSRIRKTAKPARRTNALRVTALGVECLESRELLSLTPALSIEPNQFFGAEFTPVDTIFRVTFTDTFQGEGVVQYDWSIDWDASNGTEFPDVTGTEESLELFFDVQAPIGRSAAAGDPIVGHISVAAPFYTLPGDYTVTVKLNETVLTTPIKVHPNKFGLQLGDVTDPQAFEGSPFTLTLPTEITLLDQDNEPFQEPIVSWIINWGDAIETDGGGPTATHEYSTFLTGPTGYTITAAAVTEEGTFYAGGAYAHTVADAPAVATISGASNVAEGDLYTLNLSNDDLIQGWFIFWEGLANLGAVQAVIGNPASVTHTYSSGDISHNVVAFAFTDEGVQTMSNTLVVTVADAQQDGVFFNPSTGELSVIDTNPANDVVTISQSNGSISVTSNGGTPVVFNASDVDNIEVVLGSGHDIVVVGAGILVPLTVDGGAGNDFLSAGGGPAILIGGTGNDILWGGPSADKLFGGDNNDDLFGGDGNDSIVGGAGNDIVHGGAGRDFAIGGENEDLLIGGVDEDILIGGTTIFDDVDGLDDIMAIWGSTDSFASRVAQLTGPSGLLAATGAVTDDDALDIIVGGAGRDLVFGDTNPADGVFDIMALSPVQDVLVAINDPA